MLWKMLLMDDKDGENINENLLKAAKCGDETKVNTLFQEGADVNVVNDSGLFIIASEGHVSLVKVFIDHGANVNSKEALPLIVAAENGHLPVIQLLLDLGAEIDIQDEEGDTALIKAVGEGHSEVANELRIRGANENIQNNNGDSARQLPLNKELRKASTDGDEDAVNLLMQQGASASCKDKYGNTVLHLSAKKGYVNIAKTFLDHGCDINARGSEKQTPLIDSSSNGHLTTTILLLDRGAEIDLQDDDGETALFKALRNGHSEVVNELKTRGANANIRSKAEQRSLNAELIKVSTAGDIEAIKGLMEQGASPNSAKQFNESVLGNAAQYGHDEIVKILLDNGADVNNADGHGRCYTPLMRAAMDGNLSTAKILLDNGADLDLRDSEGQTASHWAFEYPDVLSELLVRGAQENIENDDGETPLQDVEKRGFYENIKMFSAWHSPESRKEILFEACQEGKTRLVRGLLMAGSGHEHISSHNDQAIHRAARTGHVDTVRVLVEAGAEIESKEKMGKTSLIKAAEEGHLSTVKYMLDVGAEINAKDNQGRTALYRATARNHLEVVCELIDRHADRNIKTNYRYTALGAARSGNLIDIALLLDDSEISHDDTIAAKVLLTAIQNGNVNVVADLLKRGASIEIKSQIGETPIQIATRFPQMKKQEYDQELSAYKKTGHKPRESLELIIGKANEKSNAMAKLFLSQKLSNHDQESIIRRVADISDHCKAIHFDVNIFDNENKFYMNLSANNKKKETLLESCVNQGLIPEREEILEIMKTEHNRNGDSDEAQFLIKEEVKTAIPSSIGLRDCIRSVSEKFAWGKGKMYSMIALSFIMLTIAIGFYIFDVSTDLKFTLAMIRNSQRNFTKEETECRENFDEEFNNAIENCKDNFNSSLCIGSLSLIKGLARDCFENEERFTEPDEWFTVGVVSGVHVGLSVVVALIIWAAVDFGREYGAYAIVNLPIPVVTKLYKFICDIALYKNEHERKNNSEKTYQAEEKKISDKIVAYENVVNLSLIIEASVESSFQFFLQTTFILPSVILAFTDPGRGFEWTDLVNFQFLSIAMSFASFSFGFYKIRYTCHN